MTSVKNYEHVNFGGIVGTYLRITINCGILDITLNKWTYTYVSYYDLSAFFRWD
jgi:hypothetical protein